MNLMQEKHLVMTEILVKNGEQQLQTVKTGKFGVDAGILIFEVKN